MRNPPGSHPWWAAATRARPPQLASYRQRTGAMGTGLVVEALGRDPALLRAAVEAAVAEIRRVEDVMTEWRASELTRLNELAGTGTTRVPEELGNLLALAIRVSRLTLGAFDPTWAGVGRLWDFTRRPAAVPPPEAVREALGSVGYDRVRVSETGSEVTLPAGMRVGLGGIAKGYAVDRAMAVLRAHGIEHGVVNAGGDLKTLGRRHGALWRVAVPHPRERARALALLPVSNCCVVTSGDYVRCFEHEGRRYHHTLDPRTGYPSEGCTSATVLAPEAASADALATACCVLGPRRGLELVASLPHTEALLVDATGRVHLSEGLKTGSPQASGQDPVTVSAIRA